jgi:hypothetical protein
MDSHVWRTIYQMIVAVDRSIPRSGRKPTYTDVLIVGMYVWSVAHDRPLCWACRREHYGGCFRPRKLPSVSQFCRRIRTDRCRQILQGVYDRVARSNDGTPLSYMDARPLVVGACTKDRDARVGKVYGGFARGYKLHSLVTEDGRVSRWSVTSLNTSEKRVAEKLIESTRGSLDLGLVLADGNYDSGRLYDRVARCGGHLLTPLPENAGGGHRAQSPSRLEAARAWAGIAGYVYRDRLAVERCFAQQSSFGGGLGPLPPWVRTLPRVRRWVGTKLIIYHARRTARKAVS